jgi:hypothetical protein
LPAADLVAPAAPMTDIDHMVLATDMALRRTGAEWNLQKKIG